MFADFFGEAPTMSNAADPPRMRQLTPADLAALAASSGTVYVVGWLIFASGPLWLGAIAAASLAGSEFGWSYFDLLGVGILMGGATLTIAAGWLLHGISFLSAAPAKPAA